MLALYLGEVTVWHAWYCLVQVLAAAARAGVSSALPQAPRPGLGSLGCPLGSWALIGQLWSRDLNTGPWLVSGDQLGLVTLTLRLAHIRKYFKIVFITMHCILKHENVQMYWSKCMSNDGWVCIIVRWAEYWLLMPVWRALISHLSPHQAAFFWLSTLFISVRHRKCGRC